MIALFGLPSSDMKKYGESSPCRVGEQEKHPHGRNYGDMTPYSETLFEDSDIEAFFLSEYILEEADPEDYCFIENKPLLPHIERIDKLIIYRWNRKYPADMHLDINPLKHYN